MQLNHTLAAPKYNVHRLHLILTDSILCNHSRAPFDTSKYYKSSKISLSNNLQREYHLGKKTTSAVPKLHVRGLVVSEKDHLTNMTCL